jgi:hypothetical protein
VLHFYLEDDTVEINEVRAGASGASYRVRSFAFGTCEHWGISQPRGGRARAWACVVVTPGVHLVSEGMFCGGPHVA